MIIPERLTEGPGEFNSNSNGLLSPTTLQCCSVKFTTALRELFLVKYRLHNKTTISPAFKESTGCWRGWREDKQCVPLLLFSRCCASSEHEPLEGDTVHLLRASSLLGSHHLQFTHSIFSSFCFRLTEEEIHFFSFFFKMQGFQSKPGVKYFLSCSTFCFCYRTIHIYERNV